MDRSHSRDSESYFVRRTVARLMGTALVVPKQIRILYAVKDDLAMLRIHPTPKVLAPSRRMSCAGWHGASKLPKRETRRRDARPRQRNVLVTLGEGSTILWFDWRS